MELSLSRYDVNGCAVVPGVLTANEVDELRAEALRICRGDRGAVDGLAPALPGDTDDDVIRRNLCIHFPHKVSAVMAGTLSHPSIVDGLVRVIGPDVKAMQSMLFTKGEGRPGQAWHRMRCSSRPATGR
jgi:hypothetical protein